jgi:hypothetical protein
VLFVTAAMLAGAFKDPEGDAVTSLDVAGQPEGGRGSVAAAPGGVVAFTPPFNQANIKSTFKVAAKDTGGAASEGMPVTVDVLGGLPRGGAPWRRALRLSKAAGQRPRSQPRRRGRPRFRRLLHPSLPRPALTPSLCRRPPPACAATNPKLARPIVRAINITVSGCGPEDVDVKGIEVEAGLLRLVRNARGKTRDVGLQSGVQLQVLPRGASQARDECDWRLPPRRRTAPGATRTYKFSSCNTCGNCLDKMEFRCGETYLLRVQARGSGGKLLDSEWSADVQWRAVCTGDAGVLCYKG